MGNLRGRTQAVTPTGAVYDLGAGAPASVRGRGFFCISVADRSGTVYTEAVPDADTYEIRLRALKAGIEEGTWIPPQPSEKVMARRAKAEAQRTWHEDHRRHPVIEGAVVAARMAAFALVFAVVGLIGSPKGFAFARTASFVAAWAALWFVLTLLALRHRAQH